jgi:hypothetical protein
MEFKGILCSVLRSTAPNKIVMAEVEDVALPVPQYSFVVYGIQVGDEEKARETKKVLQLSGVMMVCFLNIDMLLISSQLNLSS